MKSIKNLLLKVLPDVVWVILLLIVTNVSIAVPSIIYEKTNSFIFGLFIVLYTITLAMIPWTIRYIDRSHRSASYSLFVLSLLIVFSANFVLLGEHIRHDDNTTITNNNESTVSTGELTQRSENPYDVFLPDYVANDVGLTLNDLVGISNFIASSEFASGIKSLTYDSYSTSDDVITLIITNQDKMKYMINIDKDRNITMEEYTNSDADTNLPGTPIYKFNDDDKAKFTKLVEDLGIDVSSYTVNSVEERSCCYYVFYQNESNVQCYLRYSKDDDKITEYGTVEDGEKVKTADLD